VSSLPDGGTLFSERHLRTLDAVCRTLAPPDAGPGGDPPAELADLFSSLLAAVASPEEHHQLRRALTLLDSRTMNFILTGQPRRLASLDQAGRERVLCAWAASRLPRLRAGFQAFKRLTLFLYYARLSPETGDNPSWAAMNYPGPVQPNTMVAKTISLLPVTADTELEADAVVIGSGAGGAVVAAELAAAGHRVIVLEKGGYFNEADFDGAELTSMGRMYEKRGLLATSDGGIMALAGSNLGGGTTVNWTTSLRTPDHVLRQWERECGVAGAAGPEWQASLDAVCSRINVNTDESVPNPQNQKLIDGCEALGYGWRVLPRNVKGCQDCGYCGFGCRVGAKQGTLETYLQDASDCGARVVPGCRVEAVTVCHGVATGVRAVVNGHRLTVRSSVVVAAAGSIHTPALLIRSGLGNKNIGRHLHLHPVVPVFGIYDAPIESWRGTMQAALCDEFADLDRGYGFVVEVPPAHPGLLALVLPWRSSADHHSLMRQARNVAGFIAITRDRDGGEVRVDRDGQPVLHYKVSAYDARHVVRAAQEAARLHAGAGAHTVGGPYNNLPRVSLRRGESVETYVRQFPARGVVPNDFALFSAHQMSSCRMGGSPRLAPVTPEGETYEVKGLYVADGSALPTSTGVNPMVSIMALAHRTARVIKTRL
jgi:choline dehydrogenase-like flavoprotein